MKNTKSYIAGVLTGALVFSAPVLAGGVKQLIEAELNTVNVTVDGVKVEGENILYNDKTYVPLRAIAEMLKKDVSWDEATNTADIADSHSFLPSQTDDELLQLYVSVVKAQDAEISDSEAEKIAKESLDFDQSLIAYAKEKGIEAGEEFETSYKNYIDSMNKMYGGDDAFVQLLNALGYTEDSYKRMQTVAYIKANVLQSGDYSATEDEIADYYASHTEEFKYDGLRAKHILFSTINADGSDMTDAEAKNVEKKAYEIYNKIKRGSDFDTFMNNYSEDPGLASNPDGYIFTKGEMVKEFEEAAYKLDVGKISVPVKTSYGYHIIKLEEKIEYLDLTNESVKNYVVEQIKDAKLTADVNAYSEK